MKYRRLDGARAKPALRGERLNIHVHYTNFRYAGRILKITKSLADASVFDRIQVLAVWEPGLPQRETIDEHRKVRRIKTWFPPRPEGFAGKSLARMEWLLRSVWISWRRKPACVNCHSVWALPYGAAMKLLTGCTVVYDTHELEAHASVLAGSRRLKILAQRMESALIRYVDRTIVVSESIAGWYRRTYGLSAVDVVRNVPYRMTVPLKSSTLKTALGIPEEQLVFLLQGLLAEGRGIETALEVFKSASCDKHLVLLGFGPLEEIARDHGERYPNIHFHPAVPPEGLLEVTAGADVGLALIENISLSYYYSLPNKVFEYIQSGLPIVVSNFPEMAKLVDDYRCGWKLDLAQEAMGNLIESIDADSIEQMRPGVSACGEQMNWENEEGRLLDVYRKLGLC